MEFQFPIPPYRNCLPPAEVEEKSGLHFSVPESKHPQPSGFSGEDWKGWIESPFLWGAIGMATGVTASIAPAMVIGYVFAAAWVAFAVATVRHLLLKKPVGTKIVGLLMISVVALGLYLVRRRILASIPPPQKLPSANEIAEAFCKRSPALCSATLAPLTPSVENPSPRIILKADAASQVVARIYTRGIAQQGTANFSPSLQELFYDWILTLSANHQVSEIAVILKEPIAHVDERINVVPEAAVESISDQQGKWMSGFSEPGRDPDYYERIIRLKLLPRGQQVHIVIRHPLKWQAPRTDIRPIDIAESFQVAAPPPSLIKTNAYDSAKQIPQLTHELNTIANWHWSGLDKPSLPIRLNPDIPTEPLRPNEFEATVEARCQESACSHMLVRQLEVRKHP